MMALALLDWVAHQRQFVNIRGSSYRLRRHATVSKAIHPVAAGGNRVMRAPARGQWREKVTVPFSRNGEVMRGNSNDAAQFQPWLPRQYDLYDRWPRQISCDGCFASRPNLAWAKEQGIRDVAFVKKRGLKVGQIVRSR